MNCRRTKLSINNLFKLKPGDKFVVFWAKDDDLRDIRLNYQTLVVSSNDGDTILANGADYEWCKDESKELDPEENVLDTSRGYAYFFKAR